MKRGKRTDQGAALILALVIVAILSALLSGILLFSVSHLALSNTNSSYANALNLAEAGINWELWKLGHDISTADVVQTPWIRFPDPPEAGQKPRYYRVQIQAVGGGTWAPPAPCMIVAQGKVDDVVRTIRVKAQGQGLFGKYALFGINSFNVGGNATVNGAAGTDGVVNINGNPNFNGNFWYQGPGAIGDSVEGLVTGEIFHSPLPEIYPTVNTIASDWAQAHWGATPPPAITVEYFKTHNNNSQIVNSLGQPVQIKNYTLDSKTFGADGIIVLPPGDYYFEKMELPGNNTIRISNSTGVVNIWLGPEGGVGKDDTVNGCMEFASHDVSRFHLYDGSARTLKMNGTMDFYGCIFAYNGPNKQGNHYGSVQINGTGNVYGSVIGYDVSRMTGNSTITFQSTGGGLEPGDPVQYWGIGQTWEEVNPV